MTKNHERYLSLPTSIWMYFLLDLSFLSRAVHGGMVMTRPGRSDTECARMCRQETNLDCRFYKWNRRKAMCFLSAENDTSISRLKAIEKPNPPKHKPASSWISQLQARIMALEQRDIDTKVLKKEIENLRSEMVALKNSRALTHHLLRTNKEQQDKAIEALDDKIDLINSESKRTEDAIVTLGELQKTFGKKMADMNEERRSTVLSVAMLGQTSKGMKSSIQELSILSTETNSGMDNVKKRMTQLEVQFAGLSSDIMEKVASIDSLIGPDIKRMKNAQTSLAQALSLLTKKIIILVPKIPVLQRAVRSNEGKIQVVWKKSRGFKKEISKITERISLSESELRTILEPSSKQNRERRQVISHLQEQVETLVGSQRRLQNDVLLEISDRTRLYKELAEMKANGKQLLEDMVAMQTKTAIMRKSIRDLILHGPHSDLITKLLVRQVQLLKNFQVMRQNVRAGRQALTRFKGQMVTTQSKVAEHGALLPKYGLKVKNLQMTLLQLASVMRKVTNKPDLHIDAILKGQNAMMQRVDVMESSQRELRQRLLAYATKVGAIKSADRLRKEQHLKEMTQLRMLRSTTSELYDMLRDLLINSSGDYSLSDLKKLKTVLKRHRKAWNSLNEAASS